MVVQARRATATLASVATYAASKALAVAPEEAYAYRLDFTNLPSYNPDVTGLAHAGSGEYTFRLRIGPLRVPVRLKVTEAHAPERIRCEIDAFMPAVEVCEFEATGGGTLLTFTTTVDSRSGPLRPLVDRFFVIPNGLRQVRRELDLIAAHLEARR